MVVRRMAETARQGLLTQLHPLLEELSRETFETTDLSVCERNQATFVDQVVAPHRLRVVNVIGESLPLHCTAAGKAFLAALPEDARALTLKRDLDRYTARTLTDPARLEAELERIRAEEVAYDIEEHTEGLCATATLLRGRLGGLFAVGIPVPAQRFHGHQDRFRTALLGWRDRVEEQLSRAD
jgi:DNA-binding IclR family transcriptional regulator